MSQVKIRDIHGKLFTVEVAEEISPEVLKCLDEENRLTENIIHQDKRSHDERGLEDYILFHCAKNPNDIKSQTESPEDIHFRKALMDEIMSVLANCTDIQKERFLLHSLGGLSFREIGTLCGCSKVSVFESVEAVRKKILKNIDLFI